MKRNSNFCFWEDKKLTADERNELLIETVRKVFASEDGKIVLNMLLTDLRMFDTAQTEREQALNDYGKFFIRERLGVRNTKAITDCVAETAVPEGGI